MSPRGAAHALRVALLATATASAQGRTRRPAAAAPIELRLASVEHLTAAAARPALPPVLAAVTRCVEQARAVDPASLAAVRRVDVVVRLTSTGRAAAAELDPTLPGRGFSSCVGNAFLAWSQGRVRHPRAVVRLVLELRSPEGRAPSAR